MITSRNGNIGTTTLAPSELLDFFRSLDIHPSC